MRRKKSSFSTILIIILLIIVGIIFVYNYTQDKKLEINNSNITDTKEKEEKEEEVSLDSEIVKNAINDFNNISAIEKYKGFKVDSLDKHRLIITAINGLEDDQITWCITTARQIKSTITIDDLNKALNKYIKDVKLTIDDIKNNKGETGLKVGEYGYDPYAITIDADNSIHVIGGCNGRDTGLLADTILSKEIKAYKEKDELRIHTKVAYGRINRKEKELSYDYYKDDSRSGEMVETVSINNDLTWDKYDTFIQIYKKSGDKYYYDSTKKDE